MRYYEQRYPEVDELVMVQVRSIAEMGAYVRLVSLLRFFFCFQRLTEMNSGGFYLIMALILDRVWVE